MRHATQIIGWVLCALVLMVPCAHADRRYSSAVIDDLRFGPNAITVACGLIAAGSDIPSSKLEKISKEIRYKVMKAIK